MEGKKKGRRAYLDDYKKNGQGRYEYGGKLYSYRGDDLGRRRFRLGVLCILAAAAMIAAGCVDAPGMRGCFYVLLPYAAGLAGAAGVCLAVYRFCAGGDPVKAYVYEAGVQKIPGRAALAAICSAFAAAGEAAYVLRRGIEGKFSGFAAFLALEAAAAALSAFLWKDAGTISGSYSDRAEAFSDRPEKN